MPSHKGEALRKVTLNLFDADVEDLGHYYGHGWSEVVRNLVRDHLLKKRNPLLKLEPDETVTTIGDAFGQRD